MNATLAQQMCDMITRETTHQVIMVGKDGKIFAASDRKRIGAFHLIAKKVLDGELNEGIVTAKEANEKAALKPGITLPVIYKNKKVLALGMTGEPEVVRPIIGITRQNIIMHIQSEEKIEFLNEKVAIVNKELNRISEFIQQISGVAQEIATESEVTVSKAIESVEKLAKMVEILEIIKSIARRSNIIGINAAIEAARVGAAGRGFSVVAKEVQNLANSSKQSTETISEILKDIDINVRTLLTRVKENSTVQQEQANAIQGISNSIIAIEEGLENIVNKMKQ
ncbi:methyl-accepting chemotaxis protein [Calidifontibacillus erzurumensis]|uniref:Methyl-accepting transducer domain-containing protein n=1 Tax=Calidifontibacillus erzurumensis TaxID=2741433 RepID=A0A8J8GBN4_9BACI|nr:methyl-accepting chemotaxis protein [Calidifontibacillus erzurumensis]NSL50839.1 hypothetical protein [Calidifontibacillus erzurumensis]